MSKKTQASNSGNKSNWFKEKWKNKGFRVASIIAMVLVAVIVVGVVGFAMVRGAGLKSLETPRFQEYDQRYVSAVAVSKSDKFTIDEIYEAGGFEDISIVANLAPDRNFDLMYNRTKYNYNKNITTLLVLGIDHLDPVSAKGADEETGLMLDGGQSDAIYLLSIDKLAKKFWMFQIPRDSVAYVDYFYEDGTLLTSDAEQITLQHAMGDGLEQSNDRAGLAISRMLYGLPIHSVTSVNMGGMIAVNDAVGGVTVESLFDFTTYGNDYGTNETFVKGEKYHLMGTSAYNYVHFRDIYRHNTANERLERQKQYLNCFFDTAWTQVAANPLMVKDVYDAAMDYVVTDLSITEMIGLATEAAGCSFGGIYTPEGQIGVKEDMPQYERCYLDQDKLMQYLIDTYYVECEEQ